MSTKILTLKNVIANRISMQDVVYGISAVGLGLSLPHIFHTFGLGSTFLPMYLPVLTLGLLSTPLIVTTVAIITPLISYLISGMPPMSPPIAFIMSFQLALLGLSTYFFTQRVKWNFFAALLMSVFIERLTTLILSSTVLNTIISTSHIYESYPGILLQIIGATILYRILKK